MLAKYDDYKKTAQKILNERNVAMKISESKNKKFYHLFSYGFGKKQSNCQINGPKSNISRPEYDEFLKNDLMLIGQSVNNMIENANSLSYQINQNGKIMKSLSEATDLIDERIKTADKKCKRILDNDSVKKSHSMMDIKTKFSKILIT